MNIAVFGGSFDPIHIAHVAIVNKALKTLDIDKLIVVPTYLNPFKNSFTLEPKMRFDLLKKVFQNLSSVEICDYEISNSGSSYTINTIKYLKEKFNADKIYFIIGADNLQSLDKWYKIDELKQLVEFVVATRDGFNKNVEGYKILDININISSTELRNNIDFNFIPEEIKEELIFLQNKKKVNVIE